MRYSEQWYVELQRPVPEDRRLDRPTDPNAMTGFWRIQGAKTKPDYPVAIWKQDGEAAVIFQIGRQQPMNTIADKAKFDEFCEGSWLKCVAVTHDDWNHALQTGRWPDGKPSRQLTTEEKLDLPPAAEGGNEAPVTETLAEQISNLADKIAKTPEPTSQEKADALAGLLDRMRGLLKLAEGKRVEEKEPHLVASREVDARWRAITSPGQEAYDEGERRKKAYLRKEQMRREEEARKETERLRREAEEAARIERERIAAETAERLRREAEERVRAEGEQAMVPSDEEIAEEAAAIAAEQVEVAPVEEVQPERAVAGSAYGTSRGLKKVKVAKIVDMDAFRNAPSIAKHVDMIELLHKLAQRAAKAGIEVEGMAIVEELA